MSSKYNPIAILYPTTHIWNTQHWPHVQYVQSYHYFRSHNPYTEHTTLTTCLGRTVLMMIAILDANIQIWNTQHWPHVHYAQSYCYIRSHHPHMEHTELTTMSRMYSPITMLEHTTLTHNKQHWPHVQYVQSYHYIRFHHPHMEHTTLTTCPVCTVLSLF